MPLAIEYVSGDAALAGVKTTGGFRVYGLTFTSGELVMAIGPYSVTARIDANGAVISSTSQPQSRGGHRRNGDAQPFIAGSAPSRT